MLWVVLMLLASISFSLTCGFVCFICGAHVRGKNIERKKEMSPPYYQRQSIADEEKGVRREYYSEYDDDEYDDPPPPPVKNYKRAR